ncbi:hypothetical protein [Nocardia tenerifensis]|uniref:hypothetical protein n=1 Tax=Nocardia tenerifensis TaxID=228006 RepID=UPI0011B7216A|nr:hypothetical protein [Nocardia tenerifensis]
MIIAAFDATSSPLFCGFQIAHGRTEFGCRTTAGGGLLPRRMGQFPLHGKHFQSTDDVVGVEVNGVVTRTYTRISGVTRLRMTQPTRGRSSALRLSDG